MINVLHIPIDGAGLRKLSADVACSQLADAWKVIDEGADAVTGRLARGNTSEGAFGSVVGCQIFQ